MIRPRAKFRQVRNARAIGPILNQKDTPMHTMFRVGAALATAVTLALAAAGCGTSSGGGSDADTITIGISGPKTGDQAEYGKNWTEGANLALEEINAAGGVKGKKLKLDFQDSQGQAAQATTIAQKFVSDKNVVAVMGDFSSATSMVASPIYQRGQLVQLGITNSHPDFTKTGDYIFSPSITQSVEAKVMADGARKLGTKAAVFYLNTDWGKTAFDIFKGQADKNGLQVVYSTGVEETSSDFKPLLLKAKESGADVVQFITYYSTTSLLVKQARQVGLTAKLAAVGSNFSPEFLKLAGADANGVILDTAFFPGSSNPNTKAFVDAFTKKYGYAPNNFAAVAYDGVKQLAWAYENSDGSRTGIRDALASGKEIPSVIYAVQKYNGERRIDNPTFTWLVVKDGQFVENALG